jgi:hypothetical protein
MFSPNPTINKVATTTVVVDADTPPLGATHTAFLADGTFLIRSTLCHLLATTHCLPV